VALGLNVGGEIFTLENKKRPGAGGVLPPLGVGPGNTIGFEPLPSGPWDWNFGRTFAETDAAWGFTALLPQHPDQLWRGDQWGDSGFGKYLVKSGRLLLQTPYDSNQYRLADRALDAAVSGEDAVALEDFTFDGSENGGPASVLFCWGQTSGGAIDFSNFGYIQIAEIGMGKWLVNSSLVQGGGGSIVFSNSTFYDLEGCPFHAMGMQIKAGEMHFYVGSSVKTMFRLGPPQGCSLSLDRIAILVTTSNMPNNTIGLGKFLRRTDLTF